MHTVCAVVKSQFLGALLIVDAIITEDNEEGCYCEGIVNFWNWHIRIKVYIRQVRAEEERGIWVMKVRSTLHSLPLSRRAVYGNEWHHDSSRRKKEGAKTKKPFSLLTVLVRTVLLRTCASPFIHSHSVREDKEKRRAKVEE